MFFLYLFVWVILKRCFKWVNCKINIFKIDLDTGSILKQLQDPDPKYKFGSTTLAMAVANSLFEEVLQGPV